MRHYLCLCGAVKWLDGDIFLAFSNHNVEHGKSHPGVALFDELDFHGMCSDVLFRPEIILPYQTEISKFYFISRRSEDKSSFYINP